MTDVLHIPAMVDEVLDVLRPGPGMRFIDATLGDGGHTEALLNASAPDGRVLGIERDPEMLARARKRLEAFTERSELVGSSYTHLRVLAEKYNFSDADGILFDLGVASWHFDASGKGFSFGAEEPLDMRFNPDEDRPSAAEIINHAEREELTKIFRELGQEPEAAKIADAIVSRRPVANAHMLANIISQVKKEKMRIHPATRVFQSLRIAVNDELHSVETALPEALQALKLGGMLAVIAYHSLEDRIVKQFMRTQARQGTLELVFDSPQVPTRDEVTQNPRVRSAKLRAAKRIS